MKAGHNAMHQLKLALTSRNPEVILKCWLFIAMSSIQQRNFGLARNLIENVFAVSKEREFTKLCNMCKGIWSRLKFERKQARKKMRELS